MAALKAGAKGMLVEGSHDSKVGIINLRKNTKFNTQQANQDGLSAYTHDSWVADEVFSNLRHLYPYDLHTMDMSETIDAVATMLVLGVEKIEVRH